MIAEDEDEFPRIVELPFRFGEVVYLKLREQKVPGQVIGYCVNPGNLTVRVVWCDDGCEQCFYPWQLTRTYEPILFPGS